MLLVWEPTLTSTGINTGQASQVKCVFVLLKVIHIFYVNDLFGIEIGNLLLLNVSRINALFLSVFKSILRREDQDGGGVGRGEQFLPHKFIKRAFKRRVNSTKQLLNAGRGHQAPRKATQLFDRR